VIDQAVDAIARDLSAAAVFAGDRLQRRDERSLINAWAVLAGVGAGGLQQVLADMQLAGEAGAQRVAQLVQSPSAGSKVAALLSYVTSSGAGSSSGIVTVSASPCRMPDRRGTGSCSPGPKVGRAR
jgi:hypothetical protein